MHKALVIAYLFPPTGGVGVQRVVAFARHLPSHGWEPVIVTAGNDAEVWIRDPTLEKTLPPSLEVLRTDSKLSSAHGYARRLALGPARSWFDAFFSLPDPQIAWAPSALRLAEKRIGRGDISVLFSTSAPWTNHLVAMVLARKTGLPWVADFRDPWTLNEFYTTKTSAHRWLDHKLEAAVYRNSTVNIQNTETNLQQTIHSFPEARTKTRSIPNGYEEEDFRDLPGPPSDGSFRIGYAGTFYRGRGPEYLYALLDSLLEQSHELRQRLRLVLIGRTEQGGPLPVRLRPRTEVLGFLPRRQAIQALSTCHASTVLMPPRAKASGMVPAKVYEALRLERPILGIMPPGEAATLIRRGEGGSLVIEPQKTYPSSTLDKAATWLHQLMNAAPHAPRDLGFVKRFDRVFLSAQLAEILATVAGRS